MASRKPQRLQLSKQEDMGKKTVGRKRKGKTQGDALMLTDTEDENVLLAQAFSIKKKKSEGTSSEQAKDKEQMKEATTEQVEVQVEEDQTKETPVSKGKRRKQKAKRTLDIVESEQNPEPTEKVPESKSSKPEESKKQKKSLTGENFIRFAWFNDFQTHGIWLDGFGLYPIGFSSLI